MSAHRAARPPVRELMAGYVGVKFKTVRASREAARGARALYADLRRAGERLAGYGMAPQNGGNISVRLRTGFAITSSGSNLGSLISEDVVQVEDCDLEHECVCYRGKLKPSSETFLHYLILRQHPAAGAVVHAHDPMTSRAAVLAHGLVETPREEPYGTLALARLALDAFASRRRIIVLRNHGYVCIGEDLEAAVETIISTHRRLRAKKPIRCPQG